jgi:hypothetical protein
MKKYIILCSFFSAAALYAHESIENPDAWRSKVFSYIYQSNHWKSKESFSGPGSELAVTHEIRTLLPAILKALCVETLLDAGCGDVNWVKELDLDLELYIGADIVGDLIDRNQLCHGNDKRCFLCLDITKDHLPSVDAIMCRDCLAHMSYADIKAALRNFKKSGARYLIASNFPRKSNTVDIRTGDYRAVNLQASPFNFPEPLMTFVELSAEPAMKKAGKCLSVWRFEDIVVE